MENERPLFKFYRSYWTVANELSDKDRLSFYDALIKKQFTGEEPNLKGMSNFAYISQKHNIDAQVKGFEDKTGVILTPTLPPTAPPTLPPTAPPTLQIELELKTELEYTCFLFIDFWNIYPNKSNKAEAEKKFNKLSESDKMLIKNSINHFVNFKPFKDYNHPMATTYINQKRWMDVEEEKDDRIPFPSKTNYGFNIDEYEG